MKKILLLILFGCVYSQNIFAQSYQINISSKNLSEDGTIFSSQNDELLLLVYENQDSILDKAILKKDFVFNKKTREISFRLKVDSNSKLILLLIEKDTERSSQSITAPIRLHFQELKDQYLKRQSSRLEEFMSNDDILLLEEFNLNQLPFQVIKKDYQNMDRYEYALKVIKE